MAKLTPGSFELNQSNHNQLVSNLLKRTREISPQTMEEGMNWYPSGKAASEHVGEGDVVKGAGILSKLSPQKEWAANTQMGFQMREASSKQYDPLREAIHTRASKEDIAKARVDVLGESPLKSQTTSAIVSADNIRTGRISAGQAFKLKGAGSKKTGDFHVALATGGETPSLPVDTHAYDAALDRYDIPYGTGSEHMKSGGAYDFVQSAYIKAHGQALKQKLIPSEMTPAAFQAAHWVHHQLGKAVAMSRVEGQARSNIRTAQKFATQDKTYDPTTHGLAPLQTEEQYGKRLEHFRLGTSAG